MHLTGECFCGEVKYQLNGPLKNPRSCHCSRCRKAFSGQASAYAEVNPKDFTWTAGEALLTTYANQDGFGMRFCSKCGSKLCGIYQDQVHGIMLGCLNEDPGITLEQHIFVGSKAGWEVIPEGVPQYQEHAD
ncbi:MAG: GFA family protein [Pseudomonadales bacterium]|nr:GFA family protein [Pseudomonadales bacterium]